MTIFEAAQKGDVAQLRVLLRKKAKVDAPHPSFVALCGHYVSIRGGTALMMAAGEGHLEAARVLLDAGANVNAREVSGWTPLLLAALLDHAEVIRLLGERGADLSVVTREGDTALLLATSFYRQRYEAALAVLDLGAEVRVQSKNDQQTPLHQVAHWTMNEPNAEQQTITLAQRLLEAGAKVDARDYIRRTPLHLAAERGNVRLAQLLLNHGANINARDHQNSSPLHEACDQPAMTEFLLEHGAKPNYRTKSLGLTPLHFAALKKQPSVIRFLAKHGAKLDLKDEAGETPLAAAASKGDVASFELLLKLGAKDAKSQITKLMAAKQLRLAAKTGDLARIRELLRAKPDVNAAGSWQDEDWPPLFAAAQEGHLAIAKVLLAAGADANLLSQHGATPLTPLFVAAEGGHAELVKALLAAGANANFVVGKGKDSEGSTPLLAAAKSGSLDSVKALLAAGAHVNVQTKNRTTPLLAAALCGHGAVAEALLEAGAARDRLPDQCLEKLLLPDACNKPAFRQAVEKVQRRAGVDAKTYREFPEGVVFDMNGEEAKMHRILDQTQEDLRTHGFSLLYVAHLNGDRLALLPTTNDLLAVASLGPLLDGAPAMFEWINKLKADFPFFVYGASYATLMLRFTGKIADPLGLAKRLFRLGSDERGVIVNGEHTMTETHKALAEALKQERPIVRLWWD
jgi:ankyrin repeat protein